MLQHTKIKINNAISVIKVITIKKLQKKGISKTHTLLNKEILQKPIFKKFNKKIFRKKNFTKDTLTSIRYKKKLSKRSLSRNMPKLVFFTDHSQTSCFAKCPFVSLALYFGCFQKGPRFEFLLCNIFSSEMSGSAMNIIKPTKQYNKLVKSNH